MKFLIRESGELVNWNGDVSSLPEGVYYLVKRIETIRVVGNAASSIVGNAASSNGAVYETEEPVVGTNNDKAVGNIRYYEGLRYVATSEGLERFAAADEPQIINGELFSGAYSAGKFTWDRSKPKFAPIATQEATQENQETAQEKPLEKQKEKKKKQKEKSEASVDELLEMVDKLEEVEKLSEIAKVEPEVQFDDGAFLDDLADLAVEDSVTVSSDGVLTVQFEGSKYSKKFKTASVAESQKEVFENYLKNDREMASELLYGSMNTFTKQA